MLDISLRSLLLNGIIWLLTCLLIVLENLHEQIIFTYERTSCLSWLIIEFNFLVGWLICTFLLLLVLLDLDRDDRHGPLERVVETTLNDHDILGGRVEAVRDVGACRD